MCDLSTKFEKPILSFEELYYSLSNENTNMLYPKTTDDQAQQYANELTTTNPFDKFDTLPIKPVIRTIDLNAEDENTKPKTAWQIGFEFDF